MSTEVQEQVVNNPVDELGHPSSGIGENDKLIKGNKLRSGSGKVETKKTTTRMSVIRIRFSTKVVEQEYVGDKNKVFC